MNISAQFRTGEIRLPAELHLANGAQITCTELIQHNRGKYGSVVLKGRWESNRQSNGQPKTVLVKMILGNLRSARIARWEREGHRIAVSLNIKTPELYFSARCDGGYVIVFEFLNAVTLNELWQSQPQRRAQIADWGVDILLKLHRHGYRHVDFHLNNFLAVDDVFYAIDVRSIRAARLMSEKYGHRQRHNIAKCFSRYDPQTLEMMIAALGRKYPQAANDPKLMPTIIAKRKLRAARREKPGGIRRLFRKIGYFIRGK